MAGPSTHIDYVSDDGNTYRMKMDASNATAMGNSASTNNVHLPPNYRARYVLAIHPTTGRTRKLVASTPDNAIFVGTSTVTIEEFAGAHSTAAAHAVKSRIGERRLNTG
jgi:hypothetical protein